MTRVHAAGRQPDRRICPRAPALRADPGRAQARDRGLPVGRGQELLQASGHRSRGHRARRRGQCPLRRRREQGASTITQQVAKNFLLTQRAHLRAQDPRGAARAAHRGDLLRRTRSSSSISTRSISAWPAATYGVAAAALDYFGKSVHELTIAEAAYLAALPKGAEQLPPLPPAQAAIERRNWVIDRMVDNGYVSHEDAAAAKKEPLTVNPRFGLAEQHRLRLLRRGGPPRHRRALRRADALRGRPPRSAPPSTRRCRPWPARPSRTVSCASTRRAAGAAPSRSSTSPAANGGWPSPSAGPGRRAALAPGGGPRGRRRTAAHRPPAEGKRSGQVVRERETGTVTADGVKWTRRDGRKGAVGRRRRLRGAARGQAGPVPPAPGPGDLGRHRGDGPQHGPRPRHGGRLLVRPERVQPRDPGAAPAGLFVQAVRLRDRPRQRLHALEPDPRRAVHPRHGPGPGGLGAVELRRQVRRPCAPCATASSIRRT